MDERNDAPGQPATESTEASGGQSETPAESTGE